jgi:diguanylate cyclase (GGDEF)-like protein
VTSVAAPVEAEAANKGTGLLRRIGRRGSVVHLLVILTVIPTLGLPVFSWSFVHDRSERSSAAGRVVDGLRDVTRLDALRVATDWESQSLLLSAMADNLGLTAAQRASIPGGLLAMAPQTRLHATDEALRLVRRDELTAVPEPGVAVAGVADQLAMARTAAALATQAPANVAESVLGALKRYGAALSGIQALEGAAIYRISTGRLGVVSPGLLQATAQIQAVGSLVLQSGLEQSQYAVLKLVPGRDKSMDTAFRDAAGSFNTQLTQVGGRLSGSSKAAWQRILSDPQIQRYRDSVAEMIDLSAVPQSAVNTTRSTLIEVTVGILELSQQLSALLATSVEQGTALARHDQSDAARRARTGLIGAVGMLLTTTLMLLLVGGMVRSRLHDLAASAQRLSAGRLAPMQVRGPREVAYVSEGLNDAVSNLRQITAKANLIASGDIESPLLEEPSPGPLGAAIHASFQQVVAVIREREQLQQELAFEATHDSLTGLANRAEAERQVIAAIHAARVNHHQIAVLFVDLDHFKQCNDTYGHHAGDHVLRAAAERMTSQVRVADVVSRLGGDEFVIILHEVSNPNQAVATSRRIVAALREPVYYQGNELHVSASVGICVWPDTESVNGGELVAARSDLAIAEYMFSQADRAVYRAKAAGRNAAMY